ncbi:MAG TPA: hypothetical protein VHZ52_06915 [Acidobacteriaceae bacterium]|nr:hypothetical protein [Acidobacteriaceae bacterium]
MTENDFQSGPGPQDQGEPLSATGMFLRAFDSGSDASQEPAASKPAPAVPSVPASGQPSSQPGEFTQMFQAMNSPAAPAPAQPSYTAPAAPRPEPPAVPAPPPPGPGVGSGTGPGEFTRIFVSGPSPAKEQAAREAIRPVAESPAPPAASPARMKGFSTPGISGSASAEGSFTQFFKATPAATPAPAAPPVQAYTPAPAQAPFAPAPAKEWEPEPSFSAGSSPLDSAPASAAGSATGLLSSLSSPSAPVAPRVPEPAPYRAEPLPSYTPAPPPAESSTVDSGGVTKLIQRLSQVQKEAPPEPVFQAATPPPPPAFSSGPGEFTRMISGAAAKAAVTGPPPPAPAATPAAPAFPAAPPLPAMPAPAAPAAHMPAFHAPAAPAPAPAAAPKFEAPKFVPPKVELPKIAPPALAAPKGKLEAMVPILLVVNTFLLVVILLVVIFAMKGK